MLIDAKAFLHTARIAMESGDAATLAQAIGARWHPLAICRLLRHRDADVRRVAAFTLGLVGNRAVVPPLTRALRDPDAQVNEMAEYSLWSIWFRDCNPAAVKPFKEGLALLAVEAHDRAISCFNASTTADPTFGEAYNQCAIAHFFLGQWSKALADGFRAVRYVPMHFGAISGLGHCYTQMGQFAPALKCYRHALHIHPRLHGVRKAIERLERKLRDANDASGEFILENMPT